MSHNLGIDVERLGNGNDLLGHLRTHVDFHAMSHIEHLIHLFPVGARTLMDGTEEWGNREHVVLDDTAVVVNEVEYLGLGTTCAMNHTVNIGTQLVKQLLDDGSIGACG